MPRRFVLFLLLPLWFPVTRVSAPLTPRPEVAVVPARPPRWEPLPFETGAGWAIDEEEIETEEGPSIELMVLVLRDPRQGLLVVPRAEALDPSGLEDRRDPDVARLLRERASSRDRHLAAWEEALSELGPGELVTARELVGPPEVEDLLALADDIDERREDPRTSHVTGLFRAEALSELGEPEEVARAREIASELLQHADADVAALAAGLLARLPRSAALGSQALDRLAALVDEDPGGRLDLATWALDQALRAGDEGRAEAWTDRLEAAIDGACDRANLDDDPRCATDASNLDEALGWLGLRDPADADDWRQAMEIAAHTCAREVPQDVAAELETVAVFELAWRFGAWAPEASPFTGCVERELADAPLPEAPVNVTLRILGQPT